jgi:hypothetical protein
VVGGDVLAVVVDGGAVEVVDVGAVERVVGRVVRGPGAPNGVVEVGVLPVLLLGAVVGSGLTCVVLVVGTVVLVVVDSAVTGAYRTGSAGSGRSAK